MGFFQEMNSEDTGTKKYSEDQMKRMHSAKAPVEDDQTEDEYRFEDLLEGTSYEEDLSEDLSDEISEDLDDPETDDLEEEKEEAEDSPAAPPAPGPKKEIHRESGVKKKETTTEPFPGDVKDEPFTIPTGFIFEGALSGDKTSDKKKSVIVKGTLRGPITGVDTVTVCHGGKVEGELKEIGKVRSEGTIRGDIQCKQLKLYDGKVTGDLQVDTVDIYSPARLIGNIRGNQLALSGAVKGEIIMEKTVSLEADSIVKGNIRAKTISIHPASHVSGTCTSIADDDIFDIFGDDEDDTQDE